MDFVRGDATGLLIPAHSEALQAGGEAFLNEAFYVFGSLRAGNRVSRIARLETCPGGSTGQKLFLTLEFEHPDPTLHTDLFVKFSRDFSDKIRDDRGKHDGNRSPLRGTFPRAGLPDHCSRRLFR
jgi:hypothetical protein